MPAPNVRRIFDDETGFQSTIEGGERLRTKYRVMTRDELAAVTAPGVPKRGDAYSVARPDLVCMSVTARCEGGTDNANGIGGVTTVYAEFGQRNYQWSGEVKEVQPAGVKHTVISVSEEIVNVNVGVEYQSGADFKGYYLGFLGGIEKFGPVNNGEPMPKQAGRITAEVYDFRPLNYQVPYAQLLGLATDRALNKSAITLPPPLGTTTPLTVADRQALYQSFRVEARPDALLVVHQLELAVDFSYIFFTTDANGKAVEKGVVQLYRPADLGGLW